MPLIQTDITEDCPGIELNEQSLEIVEKSCYLGETIGASRGAVHNNKDQECME